MQDMMKNWREIFGGIHRIAPSGRLSLVCSGSLQAYSRPSQNLVSLFSYTFILIYDN